MSDEKHTSFVGFKTTPTDGEKYRAAAKKNGVGLSRLTRMALDHFLAGGSKGIAKTDGEAALLAAARLDRHLTADLSAIASACGDPDVRAAVRRLALALPRAASGRPRPKGGRHEK